MTRNHATIGRTEDASDVWEGLLAGLALATALWLAVGVLLA